MSAEHPGGGAGADPPPEGTFASDWLRLREPADHESRAEDLIPILVDEWRRRGWTKIVDLGAGTGSNARYLAPRIPGPQRWVLVDHDRSLLDRMALPSEAGDASLILGDLGREGLQASEQGDLVTGAALLDLVSGEWLASLIDVCRTSGAGALFTTVYDGTIAWEGGAEEEPLEGDDVVQEVINAHQVRDKGLGAALGPRAGWVARDLFERVGYRTWLVPSPWVLGPERRALVLELLRGWIGAAREQAPEMAALIDEWGARRRRLVETGAFRLTVGHLDLLALPGRSGDAGP